MSLLASVDTHMCIWTHVHTHVHMDMCIHVYTHVHKDTCMHAHADACARAHMNTCAHAHVCTCVRMDMCVRTHTHIIFLRPGVVVHALIPALKIQRQMDFCKYSMMWDFPLYTVITINE